ncbi:MAG: thiamine pyrophosphate-binding protein [Pirellulales bacterium]|nr:thiamine pyrophosphate-binding protein [Pirellulales bacterium]
MTLCDTTPTTIAATAKTGHEAVVEQLLADGLDHMFGNPGTVEEGFLDALRLYPQMKYVLTLQESVAVLAADGYARATGKPALVQIHSTPGLGNAIGALYQAYRGHSPLVVIGGDAGIRYQGLDAQMAGDLVAMARPVTKYATMVQHPSSLLRTLRRAIKIAATAPQGPVYVCLPLDVLDAPTTEVVRPTSIPSTRVAPEPALVDEAARALVASATPMIYVGNGVAASEAQRELARVAELLGAEVWDVDGGDVNLRYDHPLYQGATGHMFGAHSKPILSRGDANLVVGTYLLPEVFPETGDVLAPAATTIHFDLNAYEIAKNHPADLAAVCDPKLALAALAERIEQIITPAQMKSAHERTQLLAKRKAEAEQTARDQDEARVLSGGPLTFAPVAQALAAALPDDAIVFDEALTNSPPLTRYLPPRLARHYFCTRGGSLGVGIPGAIGAKAAHPDKTVVAVTGDGGSMYTIQALWTAARHGYDVKAIICNNRSYRLLQLNMTAFWEERGIAARQQPLPFDLSNPPLQFAAMAASYGVASARVSHVEEIEPSIRRMLDHPGPFLLEVELEGDVAPELVGVKCGQ